MTSRRNFLAGLMSTGLCPVASWADAGRPSHLAAAQRPDGQYELTGLDRDGNRLFQVPLPDRGHAAAAHPLRPEAVAFARRPGAFAVVLDCLSGVERTRLIAPTGHHFYGHGVFSTDGRILFTTENDFEAGQGMIGVWDAENEYKRVGAFSSGGVGPHDIRLMPDGLVLVVANGGIETHPDTGRAKLNLPVMRPNLTYLGLSGAILEQVELSSDQHKNSIRHLAVRADGLVGFALQWQGDGDIFPALVGLHHREAGALRLLEAPAPSQRRTKGYAGSIAFSGGGDLVGFTAPRGNVLQVFDVQTGNLVVEHVITDVCGLSSHQAGFRFTSGTGTVGWADRDQVGPLAMHACQWDNHLVPVFG